MSNVVPGPSSPVFLGVPAPQSPAKRVPILLASSAALPRFDFILEIPKATHLQMESQLFFSKGLWKNPKGTISIFHTEWNTSEPTIDFQGSMLVFRDWCTGLLLWNVLEVSRSQVLTINLGDKSKSPKICRDEGHLSPALKSLSFLEKSPSQPQHPNLGGYGFRKWCLEEENHPTLSILDTWHFL